MYKINEYVIYKRNVCKIKSITQHSFSNKDYYNLVPINDETLTINIPVENGNKLLRNVITKEEAKEIIQKIPTIKVIKTDNKLLESEYKKLLSTEKLEDLISIIKTTYLRNDTRKKSGKKIGDKDNDYFNIAENFLYNELAISLNMSYDQAKEYVIKEVSSLCK